MREIKFRGKPKEDAYESNENWVYGFYKTVKDQHIIEVFEERGWERGWYPFVVHGETVGQYTGIKDKNGKEIYEGDICADHNEYNPQDLIIIEWRQGAFTGRYHTNHSYISYIPCLASKTHIEIIGNIHENPELLED